MTIERRPVLHRDGISLDDVVCRHPPGRGAGLEPSGSSAIVFVRRGCFVRTADGVEMLLDPSVAYCANAGEEQRYDHPHEHGDDCTALFLEPDVVAGRWGDELLPAGPLPTSPQVDLGHRLVVAAARRGSEPHELYERTLALAASALAQRDPARVACGRPATDRARRSLVDGVREALVADPDTSLPELARHLAVSPHHLSRTFRSLTGRTISGHRLVLRARGALERMTGGERDLARLAADLGFADQSHLTRVLAGQTGQTPSALRRALA